MISTATQKGNSVYVYNDNGNVMFIRSGELAGFTSITVSIRKGNNTYVYDQNGNIKFIR